MIYKGKQIFKSIIIAITIFIIVIISITLILSLEDELNSLDELSTEKTGIFNDSDEVLSNEDSSYCSEESEVFAESGYEESETFEESDTSDIVSDESEITECEYIFDYSGDIRKINSDSLQKLEVLIKSKKNNISIFYTNIDTGITITYRPDADYFSASVIKAPYVKYILSLNPDLSEKITISKSVHGIATGSELTVEELINYTIIYSDNNAYSELVKKFKAEGFNKMSADIGVDCYISNQHNYCIMSAEEAGLYFRDIYNYALTSENGNYLITLLSSCEHNKQIGKALGDKYPVAQKYGLYSYDPRKAYHNAAIVYSPMPYVLSIYTNLVPAGDYSYIFQEIALAIDEINIQITHNELDEIMNSDNNSGSSIIN
ncbi:MAG: hypothetical protein A2Y15_02175 [Clostridiales bacterium GWF2_36_10]|nr:MAG: hypothetical protein A2Y15_02175 [Clostridiales bacterium GWF2_36_10]HAN21715.1 hypothetical protein [Clostridiales bacterium]